MSRGDYQNNEQKILSIGTKISIYIPIREAHKQTTKSPQNEKTAIHSLNSIIYIVDDEKAIAQLITTILQSAGYQNIKNYNNGNEAMLAITKANRPPDVIITDVQMPPLDGVKLCESIIKKFTRDQPKFIVLSGKLTEDYIQIFRSFGVKEFLHKPCSAQDLIAALNRCLENKSNQQNPSGLGFKEP